MKVNMTCHKNKKVVLTQLQKRRITLILHECTAFLWVVCVSVLKEYRRKTSMHF